MPSMADTLTELLEVIRTTATGERRAAVIAHFGGSTLYIPKLDGRSEIHQLIALGIKPRTARWKVRGR